jgi:hypothetical protein
MELFEVVFKLSESFQAGFVRGIVIGDHQDLKAERALSTPRLSSKAILKNLRSQILNHKFIAQRCGFGLLFHQLSLAKAVRM